MSSTVGQDRLTEIRDEEVEISLLKEIPLHFLKNNLLLPLKREDGCIFAATVNERSDLALLDLARHFGLRPISLRAESGMVIDAINRLYGQLGTVTEVMDDISGDDLSSVATEFESPKDLLELTEEAPIIRLINALLQEAVKEKASDIHIEPYEKDIEVRIRVDGILRRVLSPPKVIQDALISRVKVMANIDIAEKRLPQDGRIRLLIGGRDIDIRVSTVPTTFGERVVMRLLDRKQGLRGLNELGLGKSDEENARQLLNRTNGIILVTGPTGSGKTTTLYAALNSLNRREKNIITVEDPVEYQLAGVGQIQVNPKIGLTFASGLRSILRQDPDVIMVGEVRDRETAEIAIQASLTGHLVLSTLHTNDAASSLTRLLDMGVEPYLVASSLVGVLAQRLVRVICPHCKERYKPSEEEKEYFKNLGMDRVDTPLEFLYRGKGCGRCRNSGYLGRTGIFELLIIDPDIRGMIVSRTDSKTITESAVSKGMRTLYMDGLSKVSASITTIEEVLRVVHTDGRT